MNDPTLIDRDFTPPAPAPKPASTPKPMNGDGESVIAKYNATHNVRDELLAHGYTDAPGGRMKRPDGGTASVNFLDGKSFHHSENDPLHSEHAHDSFEVRCKLDFGGDDKAAVKAIAHELGMNGNPIRHADDPGQTIPYYGNVGAPGGLPPLEIEDAADLIRDNPEMRPYVIEGLLRRQEILNFVSSSKVGKTWAMMDLALSIAAGRAWLQRFAVVRGDVLYIDAELHRQTISSRLRSIASTRGILGTEYAGHLKILSLRGRLRTIPELDRDIRAIEPGRFAGIFIDSLYKLWPAGLDENSNADVTRVYNTLDRWAEMTGASILAVHHASKGNQSGKAVTDVGSGAGAQSRAADTHLILRAHEQDDAAVLEAVVRSSPPLQPLGFRWKHPVWFMDDTLDVDRLREPGQRGTAAQNWTAESFTDAVLNGSPKPKTLIIAAAKAHGMTFRDAETMFAQAQVDGLIDVQIDPEDSRRKVYIRRGGKNAR